jgi:hypothetical protein
MKNRIIRIFCVFSLVTLFLPAFSTESKAQTVSVGAQVGGVGGINDDSAIAWGGYLNVNTYGWAAFHADFFAAPFDAGTLFSASPGFAFYPVDLEGFLFGGIVGVGFYTVPGADTEFGFNYGIIGDFSITNKFSVGMNARQHILPGNADNTSWNVMMSVGYKFEAGGEW